MRTGTVAAMIAAVSAWGLASPQASRPAVELGTRYFNLRDGYSLCPPAAATRVQERAASHMVTWTVVVGAADALPWILAARRMPTQLTEDQLASFAQQETHEGSQPGKFTVESCQVTHVVGRAAVDLRGIKTGNGQTWTRQVSILVEPGQFQILTILGPTADRDKLLAMHQAVLDSLELIDRQALAARREANLAAGRKLLSDLTAETLARSVQPQEDWALILRDGQAVGFRMERRNLVDADRTARLELQAWMMLNSPDGEVMTTEEKMLATADRSVEQWAVTTRLAKRAEAAGSAGPEQTTGLSLCKQGPRIRFLQSGAGNPAELVLADPMDRCYLPPALQSVVWQIVVLGKPASVRVRHLHLEGQRDGRADGDARRT